MKKLFAAITLFSSLAFFAVPLIAGAQESPADSCKLKHAVSFDGVNYAKDVKVCETGCTANTKAWGAICLLDTIYTITDWIFTFLVVLVGFLVIIGAFFMTTSGGDPQKFGKGRDLILYAVIGLIVALLSKAIPSIVRSLISQ